MKGGACVAAMTYITRQTIDNSNPRKPSQTPRNAETRFAMTNTLFRCLLCRISRVAWSEEVEGLKRHRCQPPYACDFAVALRKLNMVHATPAHHITLFTLPDVSSDTMPTAITWIET